MQQFSCGTELTVVDSEAASAASGPIVIMPKSASTSRLTQSVHITPGRGTIRLKKVRTRLVDALTCIYANFFLTIFVSSRKSCIWNSLRFELHAHPKVYKMV